MPIVGAITFNKRVNKVNLINNVNQQQDNKKPSIVEVDRLARELADEYGNQDYIKWYCKVIHKLGISVVQNIRAQVSDAKQPGRVFTKIANELIARYKTNKRLGEIYAQKKT